MNTKTRVLRGRTQGNTYQRLIVDDGIFTHGYRIVEFHVWAPDAAGGTDPEGYLAVKELPSTAVGFDAMAADDGRQVAWASQVTVAGSRTDTFSIIDPTVVVTQDLFFRNISGHVANYMVGIEPVTLTEPQGILTLIQERQQDDI